MKVSQFGCFWNGRIERASASCWHQDLWCSKSPKDDSRGFNFRTVQLWCMQCDVCFLKKKKKKCFFYFFQVFSHVPGLRYLSNSLFLPAACCFILSSSPVRFHLLLERETVFHLNCQTFTLKYIHPPSIRSIPESRYISSFLSFPSIFSLPVLADRIFVDVGDLWVLACCHKSLLSEFGSRPGSLQANPSPFTPWRKKPIKAPKPINRCTAGTAIFAFYDSVWSLRSTGPSEAEDTLFW